MNSIQLIGRLTKDPQLRFTKGGTPVASVRLAVPRPKRDGEDQGAVFVDITAYGSQAQAMADHLSKGRQVAVNGRLEYSEWETDGSRHSKHEVVANDVQFLGSPDRETAPAPAA